MSPTFGKSSQRSAAALSSSGSISSFDVVVNKIPFGSAGLDLSAFNELVNTFLDRDVLEHVHDPQTRLFLALNSLDHPQLDTIVTKLNKTKSKADKKLQFPSNTKHDSLNKAGMVGVIIGVINKRISTNAKGKVVTNPHSSSLSVVSVSPKKKSKKMKVAALGETR